MTLTEQWKKGELKAGYYYVKNEFGNIFPTDYSEEYDHINDVVVKDFWTEVSEIIEVLAPVPSYEEWQELKEQSVKKTDTYYDMVIAARNGEIENLKNENQQLKKLLWACQDELYSHLDSGAEAMADAITKVIGKKQW